MSIEKDLPEIKEGPDAEKRLRELARHREAKEVGPTDFNTNTLQWLVALDMPLTREELRREGNAALVLTKEEFEAIGLFDILLASGKTMTLDPDDFPADDILIIYPYDLG